MQERSRFISPCNSALVPTREAHAPREMCAKLSSLEISYASLENTNSLTPSLKIVTQFVGKEPGNLYFYKACWGNAQEPPVLGMCTMHSSHICQCCLMTGMHIGIIWGVIKSADAQVPSLETLMSLVSGGPEHRDFSKLPADCDGQPG